MNETTKNRPLALLGDVSAFILVAQIVAIQIGERAGCGDLPQDFALAYQALGIGTVTGLVVSLLLARRGKQGLGLKIGWYFVRYTLCYIFLAYGIAKIIGGQFQTTYYALDSRVGELSPMSMAWAFFGYNYSYQAVVGWTQIVAGLLFLSKRTTLLGGALLMPVIGNIVMINFFFDVCVKLNSSIYLVMTVFLLSFEWRRIANFFIANKPVPAQQHPAIQVSGKLRTALLIGHYLLVIAIIGAQGYDGYDSARKWGFLAPEAPHHGAYEVVEYSAEDDVVLALLADLDRVYFEKRNYANFRDKSGARGYFLIEATEGTDNVRFHGFQSGKIKEQDLELKGTWTRSEDDLVFQGLFNDKPVSLLLKRNSKYNL